MEHNTKYIQHDRGAWFNLCGITQHTCKIEDKLKIPRLVHYKYKYIINVWTDFYKFYLTSISNTSPFKQTNRIKIGLFAWELQCHKKTHISTDALLAYNTSLFHRGFRTKSFESRNLLKGFYATNRMFSSKTQPIKQIKYMMGFFLFSRSIEIFIIFIIKSCIS